MYRCHMEFYLVNCPPDVLETVQQLPPLDGFNHSFLDSNEPREALLSRADVVLAVPVAGADSVRALAEGMKEDAVRRALAECIRGCGWTVPEIEGFLERLGAVVSIEEQTGRLMVRGDFSPGFFSDVETLLRTIGQLAPAGLEIANDLYGLSWDALDRKDYTAQMLDARDMTWNWFETFAHLL